MTLKPTFLVARDIPDAWFRLVRECIEHGREYEVTAGSTPTKRLELDFISLQITHPWVRPLEPEIPAHLGIPNPVEPGYILKYLPYFMTDQKEENEHYTYGEDLAWQIDWVINYYREHGPGTKHCYMTVGRPESLHYYDNGGTSQCLRGVDTAIKDGKLHFSVHFRSWNLWSGLPANLGCLQVMKEYMAQQIGVHDGEIFATCLKLGLQESVWKLAEMRTLF